MQRTRRTLRRLTPLSLGLVAALALPTASRAAAPFPDALGTAAAPPPVAARPADGLADGVGINIHLLYSKTAYADFPAVRGALNELGVRHIRDKLGNFRRDQYGWLNTLAGDGIKANLTVDTATDLHEIPARLDMIAENLTGAVESIEPPNEYNMSGSPTWASDLRAYQHELYKQARSRPRLDDIQVLGPSLALRTGYAEVGDLSASLDVGNLHTYPGGFVPTRNIDLQLDNQRIIAGDKPVVVTEAGYHGAMATREKHYATPEDIAATYVPRLFLEYHRRGVRAYTYELLDQVPEPTLTDKEEHFGLIAVGGRRKPSFHALRNLIALVDDKGEAFTPGSLSYATRSSAPGLQEMLMQRRDGTFVLFLWRDVSVWDPIAQQRLAAPSATVDVTLGSVAASVATHRPSMSGEPVAVTHATNALRVEVGADAVALVIEPPLAGGAPVTAESWPTQVCTRDASGAASCTVTSAG
jgi:hypothetical protein